MLKQKMRMLGVDHPQFPRIYSPTSAEFTVQLALRIYVTAISHSSFKYDDLNQNRYLRPSEFLHASLI